MELHTPVAFFIFNRPDTTTRVFEAIRAARPSRLLVVADGPRHDHPQDGELCAATRGIISRVDWSCEVVTNYSGTNLGCKNRVSSGMDWVFSQAEEAIILEDDCLPHPSFFRFCQEMLYRYRDDERIMMIGGTNYLADRFSADESYFFSRYFAIWGWATWRRAWNSYDITLQKWPKIKREGWLKLHYKQAFMRKHLSALFDSAHSGEIDTWDIQWFYTCLFNNGLTVVPKCNLISNIGVVGTHTESTVVYNNLPTADLYATQMVTPRAVCVNDAYDSMFLNDYRKVARSIKLKYLFRTAIKMFGAGKC